jgi:hypothetical protein
MAEDRVSAGLRRAVADRAHGCCEYCRSQERFAMQAFAVEHIDPRSRAGATAEANLAYACQGCNNHKYNRTHGTGPATGEPAPLYHPRQQRWRDHFAWTPDGERIVGLSPVGRATVEALRLNREGLVNLRRLLFAAGEHPPAEAVETRE